MIGAVLVGFGDKADIREKQAWQVLLRKHEAEKMSESRQEEQQKMDDRMLRENYFIRYCTVYCGVTAL